jgi:hypothetical protein
MDPSGSMLGHVELRLRLVYDAVGSGPGDSDVPGWRFIGLLPEDVTDPGAPGLPVPEHPEDLDRRVVTEPIGLTLDRDEAEGYYLNLTSSQPSLFALLRVDDVAAATATHAPADVPQAVAVTASYNEGARWMDGGMVVVRTPLPEPLLAWIAEFAQHHFRVEERKRKRAKIRPSFLSRKEFGEVVKAELGRAPRLGAKDEPGQGPADGADAPGMAMGSRPPASGRAV